MVACATHGVSISRYNKESFYKQMDHHSFGRAANWAAL